MGKRATGHEKAGLRIEITLRRNPPLVSGNMKEIEKTMEYAFST